MHRGPAGALYGNVKSGNKVRDSISASEHDSEFHNCCYREATLQRRMPMHVLSFFVNPLCSYATSFVNRSVVKTYQRSLRILDSDPVIKTPSLAILTLKLNEPNTLRCIGRVEVRSHAAPTHAYTPLPFTEFVFEL